ncbi:MAG: MATE family efflux transporter [Nanoarchaeota archaeon]|nr:MATE family efflux transporter [Nanoarchaeota archaeon]MBU1631777.1 MATE family efflux transporter [Nanoarchaeota archaeon]MBU1876286.1 MATE family efflux transporter [Nanoarchaeota archaeon]
MNREKLLNGSITKSLLAIAVPIIFANILQTVYQLIDTFWVGRLGIEAVAAVSLSFPILFFMISLAMGLVMATSILVAQYNGKGDKNKVSFTVGQSFSLIVIMATILAIIGYFSSHYLLSFLTNNLLVLEQATSYLQISFMAILAMFIYNLFQSSLRGVGEVKVPLIIILIAVILNFFLDPVLMFGWKFIPAMGVSGVALATLVTEYLSAIIGVIILVHGRYGIRLRLKDLKLRFFWIKKIFKLGLPSSLEMSSRSFGMVLMTFVVSLFGTLTIASFGIGMRIFSFIIIPAVGFSIATSAIVGNNLGARQHERAEKIVKTGMKIGFFTLAGLGILLFIFAQQISAFFVPQETLLILESARFIQIMALTFGFIGMQMVIIGTLKAAGKTATAMFLALFNTIFLVVISYVLSSVFEMQQLGIWIAYPVSNVLSAGIAYYFYLRKDWLKKELV